MSKSTPRHKGKPPWISIPLSEAEKPIIKAIKDRMRDDVYKNGVICPLCLMWVKVYKRSFPPALAKVLVLLYVEFEMETFHLTQDGFRLWVTSGEDVAPPASALPYLEWWGLIEPEVHTGGTYDTVGRYQFTELGRDFVKGTAKVHQDEISYNGRNFGTQGEMVTIRDVMSKSYDMSGVPFAASATSYFTEFVKAPRTRSKRKKKM